MVQYPFTAVVGSDDMALALALTSVSPQIGGVLVRGEKGTAKSTMVRALAGLLPPVDVVSDCRFSCAPDDPDPDCPDGPHGGDGTKRPARLVELPVGATEDRVLGSLQLDKALAHGVTEYEPGLLASAHRGLLYVDEVNLLHDHLVDLLLDAAAMGRSSVERDGVSVSHAARFVLVGTMNPEEGELRPQLLDRFGLTVEVAAPPDQRQRADVVRRRLAYEADPDGFAASYADDERALAERIRVAREIVPEVALGDDALAKIAEVCATFEVDGMRADIVTARTASAHAAWFGRRTVTRTDIRAAALLAIPHRRRRNPFDAPGLDEELLDRILGDDPPDPTPDPPPDESPPEGPGNDDTADDQPASDAETSTEEGSSPEADGDRDVSETSTESADEGDDAPAGGAATSVAAAGQEFRTRLFTVPGAGVGEAGRRSRALTSSGRTVGARQTSGGTGSVHLLATVRAAAPQQVARGRTDRLLVRGSDVRLAVKEGRESNLVLFCVDASGSMAARRRMEQVKAAVLSLLLDAYQRRDKVGLVTFRAKEATLALPPTGSVDVAAARLRDLPAGGRTPLAEGLTTAAETLRIEGIRDPRRRPLLVVVTDGRATSGSDAVARSHRVAEHLAANRTASLVVDCETGRFRMGLAAELADRLRAEYVPLGEVAADALVEAVRPGLASRSAA